ncbi:YiiX/YebB-like N1pC/P60 family cysteine hydrolase [Candidatus Halobeggiatoa sp. HSG11]|nr:YiiX/YebB-like N1pC/P60 family cysteine hydrolase [Candidatus Halobeggiatoa sp. HSG11]
MKYLYYILILILTACSPQPVQQACWKNTFDNYYGSGKTVSESLHQDVLKYQSLIEQTLTYREKTLRVVKRLKNNINEGKPLSGDDANQLNLGMVEHLKLRDRLYKFVNGYECWLDTDNPIEVKPIPPTDRLKGIMLSLSAALTLYDNYMLSISIFEEDKKLRRFLNERDSGYGIGKNELAKITRNYNSYRNRHKVKQALQFYETQVEKLAVSLKDDPSFNYLKLLIEQSPSYQMAKKNSPLKIISRKFKFMEAIGGDTLYQLANSGVNLFSKFFGNSVGLIQTRKGKLYKQPKITKLVSQQLKAGDILLEKTPFRLTDKFIPGHWGHAAIWVGTESELRALGIWEHEVVKQYWQQIRQNHLVIEALRPGVEMNSLQDFLNVDDLAILRNSKLTDKELADRIILALRQVGKEYDFNFNVETTDKIVCSELIYVVYTGIKWPTEKALGRFTISPDNVASKVLNNGPLQLISLFHKGHLVTGNHLLEMKKLLEVD